MRGRSEPSKTNSIFNAIYNYFISCCGYTLVDVERRPVSDTKLRSVSKTISWRLTGTFCTFIVSWLILGDITTSGTIAIIQLTFNTVVFYIHERLWNFVKWGKIYG